MKNQSNLKNTSLADLGEIIAEDWAKPYFGAVPYIDAMRTLESVDDRFYQDRGSDIVSYFLGNAGHWRGEVARAVKAELKSRLSVRRAVTA